jgi:RES domain-containing protein
VIYAPEVLDALQAAVLSRWNGTAFRHMFGEHPPVRANVSGGRWNPPSIAAIYTSRERETALAEAGYYISLQPLRPKAKRTLYTINISLRTVVDLTAPAALRFLGITADVLRNDDQTSCRVIGAAVNWLGHDGLLVPSARRDSGTNLVIFRHDLASNDFEVVDKEVIAEDTRR